MESNEQNPKESSEDRDKRGEKRERVTSQRLWNVTRVLAFGVIVLVIVVIGFAFQVSQSQDQIDHVDSEVTELRVQVGELQEFVDELQAQQEDPSQAERNAAITRAVNLVPEIRSILCETFPDATACTRGG